MNVIEPTPSQAAVAMKKYFASQGFDIKLSQVQEALAQSKGYASWNVLTADQPARGQKRSKAKTETAVPEVGPYAGADGMQLWACTGREYGDDDDTTMLIWVTAEESPSEVFSEALKANARVPAGEIFNTSEELVGEVRNGSFRLADEHAEQLARLAKSGAQAAPNTRVCRKCGTPLEVHGFAVMYCPDQTCPYSDWSQKVDPAAFDSMLAYDIEMKYYAVRRPQHNSSLTQWVERGQKAADEGEEALSIFEGEFWDALKATGLLEAFEHMTGRGERCIEANGKPFVQASFNVRWSPRFATELCITLRDGKLETYVRTWEMLDRLDHSRHYEIYDEQSGDFDTNAYDVEDPDEDGFPELLTNALKEARAHYRLLVRQTRLN